MYSGFKEDKKDGIIYFYLQDNIGGETQVATGEEVSEQETVFRGSHPAAPSIETRSKEELLGWIQRIIAASNTPVLKQSTPANGDLAGLPTAIAASSPPAAAPDNAAAEQVNLPLAEDYLLAAMEEDIAREDEAKEDVEEQEEGKEGEKGEQADEEEEEVVIEAMEEDGGVEDQKEEKQEEPEQEAEKGEEQQKEKDLACQPEAPREEEQEQEHDEETEDAREEINEIEENGAAEQEEEQPEQPAANGDVPTQEATDQEEPQDSPQDSPQFAFVSYREEIRGLSDSGDGEAPRRMKHWLLMDTKGHEHAAVHTARWEPKKKRFTYEALPPFNEVRNLKCRNQRGVLEYLDQFVPPSARQAHTLPPPRKSPHTTAIAPDADATATEATAAAASSKETPTMSPSEMRRKQARGKGATSKKTEKTQQQKKQQVTRKPSAISRRAPTTQELRTLRVGTIARELQLLQDESGVQYSLTLIGPDKKVEVMTSGAVVSSGLNRGGVSTHSEPPSFRQNSPTQNPPLNLELLTAALEANDRKESAATDDGRLLEAPKPAKAAPKATATAAAAAAAAPSKSKKKRRSGGDNAIDADDDVYSPDEEKLGKRLKRVPSDPDVAAVLSTMETTHKLYLPGTWRREMLSGHPLTQVLDDFHLAEDCGEALDREALPQKLSVRLPADVGGGPGAAAPPGPDDTLKVVNSLPKPVSEGDVVVQPTWGVDSYTRAVLSKALESCPEVVDDAQRVAFIDKELFPSMNALGKQGWDVIKALEGIVHRSKGGNNANATSLAAGKHLLRVLDGLERHSQKGAPCPPTGREWCRAHSKGDGVIVKRKAGLPAGAFVGEYLGELCTAWRWAERDARGGGAVSRSKNARRMGASSDFLNIALERPKGDPRGFDVLYVDAVHRSNFVSRLGHSCDPNCRNITVVAGGRLTLGVWTTRAIAPGEELTLDFGGETDSEREAHNAVCLCGSSLCRGTFLYLAPGPGSPLYSYVLENYNLLDRMESILDATAVPTLSEEDHSRLHRHGFRELVLNDGLPPGAAPLPAWLHKWLARTLEFVDAEEAALKHKVLIGGDWCADLAGGMSKEEIEEDIAQLVSSRMHSLAVAIDRAKLFLRHQPEELKNTAPLRLLNDEHIAEYLWNGPDSIARRAQATLGSFIEYLAGGGVSNVRKRPARRGDQRAITWKVSADGVKEEDFGAEGGTAEENGVTTENGGGGEGTNCSSMGTELTDVEALAETVDELLEETEVETAEQAREALRKLAKTLRDAGRGHIGMHDVLMLYASTEVYMQQTEYAVFHSQLCNGTEGMKYRSAFLWALLIQWQKVSGDSVDSFSNDRKGSVCLPDPESCYMPVFISGQYSKEGSDRSILLKHLAENPRATWPKSLNNFTYRNSARVFGSPQLDLTLKGGQGGAGLEQLLGVFK